MDSCPLCVQHPVPKLVELAAIDEQFTASRAHLHRAVDLQENYTHALLHFKGTCGRGSQALLKDCIEIVAVRAKGSRLSLCLDVVGEVRPVCFEFFPPSSTLTYMYRVLGQYHQFGWPSIQFIPTGLKF